MDIETVAIDSLRPHPHNYRRHPEAQVAAIAASLKQFGQYRPIVVSSDGYILAGEGVWRGRQKAGCADIDAVRMPFAHDDPRAEKLLVADNELSRLAEDDDKALASLLAEIQRTDAEGLQGTGWDDAALDKLIGDLAAEDFAGGCDIGRELGETEEEYVDVIFRVSRNQLEKINDALQRTGSPAKTEALMVIIGAYDAD